MKRAPHPPFSLDLAPPDFYLFGNVKTTLMGAEFEGKYDIFDRIMGALNPIPRDELEAVFGK
jgi:hypothetical protein